jgi:hypothetical protein
MVSLKQQYQDNTVFRILLDIFPRLKLKICFFNLRTIKTLYFKPLN